MDEDKVKIWIKHFQTFDQMPALSNELGTTSYAELANLLEKYSQKIENLTPQTLLIKGDYQAHTVTWLLAALLNGWRVVPVVSENSSVIETRLKLSNAQNVVSEEKNWELVSLHHEGCIDNATDTGVILFSSGSTGLPKAMTKSFDLSLEQKSTLIKKQIVMAVLLLFDHIGGLNTLITGLKKGTHLVAPENRTPKVLAKLVHLHNVRILPCSPTFLNMMLLDGIFDKNEFPSLRLITYGSERMPDHLLQTLTEKLPKTKFTQTFGTSEVGIVQTKSLASNSTYFTIDDPDVEWKVVQNELLIKSKRQITGYIDSVEENTFDEGWFLTGDLVELKDNKYMKIIGRKKEVINIGGEKVLPKEIEELVGSLDNVIDCTAFAMPNAITGFSVGLDVVTSGSLETKEIKKKILKLCARNLEQYKRPTKIIFSQHVKSTDRFKKKRPN